VLFDKSDTIPVCTRSLCPWKFGEKRVGLTVFLRDLTRIQPTTGPSAAAWMKR
jgi:hypothetical protein